MTTANDLPVIDESQFRTVTENPSFVAFPRRSKYNTRWWHNEDFSKVHEKQRAMLCYNGEEALFGGSSGGGKSGTLLMMALQYLDVQGYGALLIRRQWRELYMAGGLIPMSHEWLAGTGAKWSEQKHNWTTPEGASLQFGHCEHINDVYQYQGTAWNFIGVDELTHFEEFIYLYLFSRLRRSAGSNIPSRVRATANPGGPGHEWVRTRFLLGNNVNRIFIHSRIPDNPFLDQADYLRSLAKLPEVERRQLIHGDWDISATGDVFKKEWFRIVGPESLPARLRLCRFWDTATLRKQREKKSDFTVGILMGRADDGMFYVIDMVKFQATSGTVDAVQRQTAELDREKYGSVQVGEEQMPASSGKNEIERKRREVFDGFWFTPVPSTHASGGKEVRARAFASAAEGGNVRLIRASWNGDYLSTLAAFPTGARDDEVDASSGAFGLLTIRQSKQIARSGLFLMR